MRDDFRLGRIGTRSDIWVGLFFALFGMAVLLEVREFPSAAARLPLLAAVLLTGLGLVLTIRASIVAPKDGLNRQLLKIVAFGPLPVAVLLSAWVYLLTAGFGFFEVGVPIVMGLVHLVGSRRLVLNALCSLAIVGFVFVLFYVVFGVQLPVSSLFTSGSG